MACAEMVEVWCLDALIFESFSGATIFFRACCHVGALHSSSEHPQSRWHLQTTVSLFHHLYPTKRRLLQTAQHPSHHCSKPPRIALDKAFSWRSFGRC